MTSIDSAKEVLEQLLDKLGFEAEVSEQELGDKQILAVESDNYKLLIGKGGDNLRALEYLVNNLARQKVDDYRYVVIDVAGYKREKEDRLRATALDAADRAVQSGQPARLRPMNSYERRIVHTALAERTDVQTHSKGEEPYRSIVVQARD